MWFRVVLSFHWPIEVVGDDATIDKFDVIVIGSGGLGAATAYYLSKRKGLSVAVLDKHEIGSQTSPRAAGMVSCARKGELRADRRTGMSSTPTSSGDAAWA